MSNLLVISIDVELAAERAQDLLDGFRQLHEGPKPDGLLRSELLQGQDGSWRIQSTWRDMAALQSVRSSGEPPPVLALLDRLGATHRHGVFTLEQSHQA